MRIPVYEQRTAPGGLGPTPRASGQRIESTGGALANVGNVMGNIAGDMLRQQEREREDDAAVAASTALAEGRLYWNTEIQRMSDEWGEDKPPVTKQFDEGFKKWQETTISAAPTEKARRFLTERIASMRAEYGTKAYGIDREKRIGLNASRWEVGNKSATDLVFSDPSQREVVLGERLAALEALQGIDPGRKLEIGQKLRQEIDGATEQGLLARQGETEYLRQRVKPREAPAGTTAPAPAAPAVTLDPRDSARLSRVQISPQQDAAIVQAAGGDEQKAAWMRAVLRIENRGKTAPDDNAVSPAGAVGSFQFMPATGRQYGLSEEDRRDFGKSAVAASRFYDDLHRLYDGNLLAMMAHYNGGGKAGQAVMRGEQPPAQETRDYVKFAQALGIGTGQPGEQTRMATALGTGEFEFLPDDQLPPSFRGLSIPQRMAVIREAEQRWKQGQARERSLLQDRVRDAMAGHKDGKIDPEPIPAADFQRAFGPDAGAAYEDYQKSREMGAQIGAYTGMSAAEIQADLARSDPPAGPGYAAADARRGVKQQAAQRIIQLREADPVGYVTQNTPALRELSTKLQDPNLPPEQRQALNQQFLQASMAEQQRLGIQKPRLLSPAQADRWGTLAMNAQRPEDSANLIAGLEMEYGTKFFPKVFEELVREKKISGELLLIPNLPTQSARENVSRVARVKESDLKEQLTPDQVKGVDEGVKAVMESFVRQVPVMNDRAVQTANAYSSIMRKLAMERVMQGQSPSEAAETAGAMLLGHYQFEGTTRIPRGVDPRQARRGMTAALETWTPAAADVPADFVGARTPEQAAEYFAQIVRARPLWHTTDDDSGVELWVQRDNGTKTRVTQGGKPVRLTWDQVTATAQTGTRGDQYMRRIQQLQNEQARNSANIMAPR